MLRIRSREARDNSSSWLKKQSEHDKKPSAGSSSISSITAQLSEAPESDSENSSYSAIAAPAPCSASMLLERGTTPSSIAGACSPRNMASPRSPPMMLQDFTHLPPTDAIKALTKYPPAQLTKLKLGGSMNLPEHTASSARSAAPSRPCDLVGGYKKLLEHVACSTRSVALSKPPRLRRTASVGSVVCEFNA